MQLVNDMDETLTHDEKDLIKRGLRGLMIAFVTWMLARNVTQVDLPIYQLSLCLGLMSCFNSLFKYVQILMFVMALEVLFPASLVSHF